MSAPIRTAWLVRQKVGRTSLFITLRGWASDIRSARQFVDKSAAKKVLGNRRGKAVLFELSPDDCPTKEIK